MRKVLMLALLISVAAAYEAEAACTAKIVSNTHADGNTRALLRPGQHWGPPTELQVNPKTATAFICAHGSFCYESDGIQLNGCKIVPLPPIGKENLGDTLLFGLE